MKTITTIFLMMGLLVMACKDQVSPSFSQEVELSLITSMFPEYTGALSFIDTKTGIMADFDGALLKSTDMGVTWNNVLYIPGSVFNDIEFISPTEGYAVGSQLACDGGDCETIQGLIVHTTDGGNNWTPLALPSSYPAFMAVAIKGDSIFAAGKSSITWSYDGVKWRSRMLEISGATDIQFINQNQGIIVTAGSLIRTTNGGVDWAVLETPPVGGIYSLSLVDGHTVYICNDMGVQRSDNFGVSWTLLSGSPMHLQTVKFTTPNVAYAFGTDGIVTPGGSVGSMYYTKNAGKSWYSNINKFQGGPMHFISFPQVNVGYGVSGTELIKIQPL